MPEFSEDCFFLGLLKNIGTLILVSTKPREYNLVMSEINNNGYNYHEAETHIFGLNHMEVGEYIAKSWGLPDTFSVPIGYHHHPEKLLTNDSDIQIFTRILHLSSLIIELFNAAEINSQLGVLDHWIKAYNFADKINIYDLMFAISQKTQHLFSVFDIDIKEEIDYDQVLNAAKIELANLSNELINDLLQKRGEIESLRQQVGRDSMTQLNNHQRFNDLLDQEISRSIRYKAPLSVIIADIDFFKSINDTFGHLAGDMVIKAVGESLKKELRESDHIARYGGEEFAVILPETSLKGSLKVAERLRVAIESLKVVYENKKINFTMSFGVAELSINANISRKELIKNADSALYRAKQQGRNRCCFLE
jgi:diguanylate cyclase (GGDEF)-like protein